MAMKTRYEEFFLFLSTSSDTNRTKCIFGLEPLFFLRNSELILAVWNRYDLNWDRQIDIVNESILI